MNKYIEKIKKYWPDPVWSKVIAAGIIFVLGTIFTTFYTIFIILYEKISLFEVLNTVLKFLKQQINFPIWILIISITLFIVFTFSSIVNFINQITHKIKNNKEEILEIKIPVAKQHSTVLFSSRMAKAFPGIRNLTWFNDPSEAIIRLQLLLKKPLEFQNSGYENEADPIWWFRGHSASQIFQFKKLKKNKALLNFDQLKIKRIGAYHGDSYFRDFVYVETYGEQQIGLYKRTKEDIKQSVDSFGFCWEEYALIKYLYFWKKPIRREDYDDGATIINGKVVNADDAELRVRYLSNYNFIISSKGSPYNCQKFDGESKKFFDDILSEKIEFNEFLEFLLKLHKR